MNICFDPLNKYSKSCLDGPKTSDLYSEDYNAGAFAEEAGPPDLRRLLVTFAAFNPHSAFRLQEGNGSVLELPASNPNWVKWLPRNPTCPHWYDLDRFRNLIAANVAEEQNGRKPRTVRDFLSEFSGLRRPPTQKTVTAAAGLTGMLLHDLIQDGDVDLRMAQSLLKAMQAEARPIKPQALGVLGRDHISRFLALYFQVDPGSIQYKMFPLAKSVCDGLPFVLEFASGVRSRGHEQRGREVLVGLNWSPALKSPAQELPALLGEMRVDEDDPVVVLMHLACPRLEVTDHGKSTLASLPWPLRAALEECATKVLKKWKKAKRQADREDRISERQLEEMRKANRRRVLSIKAAAFRVMEQAYRETSNDGEYPANARQIMYKARPLVLDLTDGKCWSKSSFFTQRLLPDFIEQNPEVTKDWDVVYDARGRLIEPHTTKRVDLGTLQVRQYIGNWKKHVEDERPKLVIDGAFPTVGPCGRFAFALFIEKEGFTPLLEKAKLAERYDLAVMSTKGMSVTAARKLVEELSRQGVTILVLRDFDKAGFSIAHTLRTDSRRYQFESRPRVIDLGLRLKEVQEMHLDSEPVEYRGGGGRQRLSTDPRIRLRECKATKEECDFLVSRPTPYGWAGERVELNAMSSAQFITFVERKLVENKVRKVIPGRKPIERAYRRSLEIAFLNQSIEEQAQRARERARRAKVPRNLQNRVAALLKENPALPWDQALAHVAAAQLGQYKPA